MSASKRTIRKVFRDTCLARDKRCRLCPTYNKTNTEQLEIHHITNRNDMPNGGYVKENGITLCPRHHADVENNTLRTPASVLYELIGSSYLQALDASKRLC